MADVEHPLASSGAVGTVDLGEAAAATSETAVPSSAEYDRRQPTPKAERHPSVAERAALGKAAREVAPRSAHGEWEPGRIGVIRSRCSRRRRLPVCPSWCRSATGGCSFAFTFFRGAADHGRRLAGRRAPGSRAALRRRPPVQLRRFAAPDRRLVFEHQRLRRDAARPVRVGPQAAGRQLRGRRARPGFGKQRRRSTSRSRGQYRGAMRGLRRDAQPRSLVLAHRRRGDRRAGRQQGSRKQRSAFERKSRRRGQGQHAGVRKLTERSTASRGSSAIRR